MVMLSVVVLVAIMLGVFILSILIISAFSVVVLRTMFSNVLLSIIMTNDKMPSDVNMIVSFCFLYLSWRHCAECHSADCGTVVITR
jgi:hypothetical protein